MKPELEKILREKYPKIFVDSSKSSGESAMAWGCECGDGWFDIIDRLCQTLSNLYTSAIPVGSEGYMAVDAPAVVATQIKEKFGTLRFYYRLEPDEQVKKLREEGNPEVVRAIEDWLMAYASYVDGAIHMAETLTMHTCEISGLRGELHRTSSGWVKVLNRGVAATNPALSARGYAPVKQMLSSDTNPTVNQTNE
jgi:hypothetical protein